MIRRRRVLGGAAAGLLLACAGCGTSAPDLSGHPNFVIVTLDTTRADHFGAYGYFRDTSPRFDALALESILFERAFAPMATTLPSHVSLFTATHPLEHGVLANVMHGGRRFEPAQRLRAFARVAHDAGYSTAAFVSAAPLKRDSGIAEGFESFDEPAAEEMQRRGSETADAALGWLARGAAPPFLLWVHFFDAHWPHAPPEPGALRFETDANLERWLAERRVAPVALRAGVQPEEARELANLYDAELRYQDAQLGRLVDALRARPDWERTALLVVADHGEGLNQHGEPAHGSSWHEQIHTPLLIRAPGQAPRRIERAISLVDALPTLLGVAPAPALAGFLEQASGRDALAADFTPAPVLSQDTGRERGAAEHRVALTTERWKYFRIASDAGIREELYDLEADPFELTDVSAAHADVARELRGRLEASLVAQRQRHRALGGGEAAGRETDPRVLEQLRALGYVEADDAPPAP